MNIIDENKYKEFYNILSGCRTIVDAYYFAEIYLKKNPEMKQIIYSMINGKKYDHVIDFRSLKSTLENINTCQYKNQACNTANVYYQKTIDNVQKACLSRIINYVKESSKIHVQNIEIKSCPHCNIATELISDIQYVICGYNNTQTGFDWKGCGYDWCFKCEKILCKKWDIDELFINTNRLHDNECCKNHAIKNNKQYPNEYCQCSNNNVNRNITSKL
jgi:hypothetical protein